MRLKQRWLVGALSGAFLLSLATAGAQAQGVREVSGAERLDQNSVVIVNDTKRDMEQPRLHIAVFSKTSTRYIPVPVTGWETLNARSDDLEAICCIPDEPGYYYAAESGFFKGSGGRIFRLHIYKDEEGEFHATSEGAFEPFPRQSADYTTPSRLQIEGIEAISHPQNGEILLLGLRGTAKHPGTLVWGQLRDGKYIVVGQSQIDLRSVIKGRSIGDLHLVKNQGNYDVLSVATADPGDLGPFESAICLVGSFDPDNMTFTPCEPKVIHYIDGLKIEALGHTPEFIPNSHMFFGTDGEAFGGFVRPLRAHANDPRNEDRGFKGELHSEE